jgi:hypothetical protein
VPAYDVDHEVIALLNRFEVNQNLVINMIEVVDVVDWLGGSVPSVFMAWSSPSRQQGWAAPQIGGTRAKTQVRALIILG